jgi:glycosyltransferase involved in cell wall biosynthesis
MKPERRLAIVIHSLAGGGAERTASLMANHWAEAGDQVTLVTLDSAKNDRYVLAPAVRRESLGLMGNSKNFLAAAWNNLRRVRALRRAIVRAASEHVISLTDNMNVLTLLACARLSLRPIVAVRADPRHHQIGRAWSRLRRRLYPKSRAIVVQTAGVRDVVRKFAGSAPIHVIPNAVKKPDRPRAEPSGKVKSGGRIVAAGRLAPEKGMDLLIEAFATIAARHPDWSLRILGEGAGRADLEDRVFRRGLSDRIELPGWTPEPSAEMFAADLFVLPSRYEGFPNALLEAMACGLPAISFDCQSGPSEIIRHEVDGLLVPAEDVTALGQAMDRLMGDVDQRRRLAQRAVEVASRFSEDLFFRRWEALLEAGREASL